MAVKESQPGSACYCRKDNSDFLGGGECSQSADFFENRVLVSSRACMCVRL